MQSKYSLRLQAFFLNMHDSSTNILVSLDVCPLTTIGVFNIPLVALNRRTLQRSLSLYNKDSSGLCH